MPDEWKFHWLTKWEEIWNEEFVLQWQEWLDQSPSAHVFSHPALVKAWVDTYLPLRDIKPFFLIAEFHENTVFFPLVRWRRNWQNAFQKLLLPVGYPDYDYHDPIIAISNSSSSIEMDSFWSVFLNMIQRYSSPVKYDRLIIDGIRQPTSGKGTGWVVNGTCPLLDLNRFKNPEDLLPSLKKSLRGDLRRQERRICENGGMQYLVFSLEMENEALKELAPLLKSHQRRWPLAYKAPHFHQNLVTHAIRGGVLHFSVLKIGKESAAWQLGFSFGGRFYYYFPAQSERFDIFSPGKVLLRKCIEDAIARRLVLFDFLRGEESYKAGWTDKAEPLWSFPLCRKKALSRVRNMMVDKLNPAINKLRFP